MKNILALIVAAVKFQHITSIIHKTAQLIIDQKKEITPTKLCNRAEKLDQK